MREHNAVVLGIRFVTPLGSPVECLLLFRTEASDIVSEHVQIGTIVDDPLGKLLSTSRAKHHSG